jgi:outer membrane protein TolC
MTQSQPRRFRPALLACAVALALGGCAVAPQPFKQEDRLARIKTDQGVLAAQQSPVSAPLTLADAVARALKYNMDHRLKQMENALATNQADLAKYDLLPKLTVQAGYSQRDSYPASSSMDIATGAQSLVPSTSQEKDRQTSDLGLTWNMLDFGVSYWQAQQQHDRAFIAEERRRKTAQTLVQGVQQAYWLAAGAQQLETRVNDLIKRVHATLEDTRKARQDRLKPGVEVLNYQRSLLELVRQLEPIRNELGQAKPRLASLMNMKPGQDFSLAIPARLDVPRMGEKVAQLEEQALLNRPELAEADYQERISVAETKKAMLRILPGIEFSLGAHRDENRFLVDKNWADGGARLTWNLLGLLSARQSLANADQQVEIARTQRLALNMAVLSQVHVALRDFEGKQREFGMAEELESVDGEIYTAARESTESGADNRLALIRAEASALVSELRKWQAYSNLSLAWAQLKSSVGVDALPEKVASHELPALAQAIDQQLQTPLKRAPEAPKPTEPAAARPEVAPATQAKIEPAAPALVQAQAEQGAPWWQPAQAGKGRGVVLAATER